MTPQPGLLTIAYTSNNPSGNRVAYQLSTDPPGVYSYVNDICYGSCSVNIPVLLDDLTCDTVTYQGYVQALCEDISSLVGRIPFTITFTPAEPCYSRKIKCVTSSVQSLELTDVGSGYSPIMAAPTVTFSTGTATANAYVADDGIKTLSLLVPAVGAYVDGSYTVGCSGTTGGGDWANTFVVVTVAGGVITSIVPATPLNTSVGSGHVVGDDLTLLGVAGLPAGTTANIDSLYPTGTILEVLVTSAGTYSTAPTAIIEPPLAGDTATVDVVMALCNKFKYTQCDASLSKYIQLELNQETILCTNSHTPLPSPATLPADYTQTHDGCCYDCHELAVTPLDGSGPVLSYQDCATGIWAETTLNAPTTVCVVDGAWYITPVDAPVSTVVGAVCP